jgi:steroid 5-alpha reductase family enzyme
MNLIVDWAAALPALLIVAAFAWVIATVRRNVGLIDIFWSLFFLAAAWVYAREGLDARGIVVVTLAVIWALRLAGYLAWRNWSAEEDRRYREIRARNEPHFVLKSLYLVFGLQALLAWLVSAPLYAALSGRNELGMLDGLGAVLVLFGIGFEAVADWQLARFRTDWRNAGKVMDQGLWRYTRHPNYFGECCVWWGFWLIAVAAGGAWTVFAPIVMTFLLLRVSGVSLLEKDIGQRRPGYREYVQRTNAFFPGPRRQA